MQMGFGKMSHFHHEFIPSLSLSEPGRPFQICAIQLEPVPLSKLSNGAFILSFLPMVCFAHLLYSVVLPERCLSPPLPCFPPEFSAHCSAALAQRSLSFELAHPALPVSILLGQLIQFVITTYPLSLLSLTFPIQKLSLTQVESSDLFLWIGFVYSYLSSSYTLKVWHNPDPLGQLGCSN